MVKGIDNAVNNIYQYPTDTCLAVLRPPLLRQILVEHGSSQRFYLNLIAFIVFFRPGTPVSARPGEFYLSNIHTDLFIVAAYNITIRFIFGAGPFGASSFIFIIADPEFFRMYDQFIANCIG